MVLFLDFLSRLLKDRPDEVQRLHDGCSQSDTQSFSPTTWATARERTI
jgi:hypothetical protein